MGQLLAAPLSKHTKLGGFIATRESSSKELLPDERVIELICDGALTTTLCSRRSRYLVRSVQAGSIILSTLGSLYWKTLWPNETSNSYKEKSSARMLLLIAILLLGGCAFVVPYGNFKEPYAVFGFWTGSAIMALGFVLAYFLPVLCSVSM